MAGRIFAATTGRGGAAMNFGQLLFGFKGRINRGKYWLAVLIYVIVSLVMATIGYFAEDALSFQLLNLIVSIAATVSGIAVGLKRLHDRDKSGWWLLMFYLVPSLLFGIGALTFFYGVGADAVGGVIGGTVISLAGLAIVIWAIVELGCLRGTLGPNRFGPDPLVEA
jgi:uncharacterized membrane protein YhaH (DUF805 family)